MAGIYIYRADRIILSGGWNGLTKKAPRLQLARLRVDVGNKIDHLFQLNVAKSQVIVPHELKVAFENYVSQLKTEAEREFYNRGIRTFPSKNKQINNVQLFDKTPSNKGVVLEINEEFPLIRELKKELNKHQMSKFNVVMRIVCNSINQIRKVHESQPFIGIEEKDNLSEKDIEIAIDSFLKTGLTKEQIRKNILPSLGYTYSTLPITIINKLKNV